MNDKKNAHAIKSRSYEIQLNISLQYEETKTSYKYYIGSI